MNRYGLTEYSNRVSYITGDYRALEAMIAPSSIDYIYSNAVLEHVADPEALFNVLGKVLALDGVMFHRVDLRCHNRFRRHGELYFHTFSPKLWKAMGHNIGHPNRWLLNDYKRLFEGMGYSVSIKQIQTFSKNVLDDAKCYIPNLYDKTLNEYETAVFDVDLKWINAKSDLS